jgi:hypothetical protein
MSKRQEQHHAQNDDHGWNQTREIAGCRMAEDSLR